MTVERIVKFPKQSFFLLGPRGTGKSTWLKKELVGAHWFDLLDEGLFQNLLGNPSLFSSEINALPASRRVVVDEIQRLPNLLNPVHQIIQKDGRSFALCGSSARKLNRSGVNLLGGRALKITMHPFLPEELGKAFHLEDSLRYGLLPVVMSSEDREAGLSAYTQLYLKSEIQAEALVRNLPGFARFLPVAALLHAQTLNASNIAREAAIARTTVAGYLDILEETLLCFRLPAFEGKLRLRERRLPKWYWCDPGLVRAMKRRSGPLVSEERGALFEGLVGQVIRAYRDYRGLCDDFFYWAPSDALETEVDFLLTRGNQRLAIEVKSGTTFNETWLKGLRAIKALPSLVRRVLVYPTGPALKVDSDIDILPFDQFTQLLSSGKIWPSKP